jgi:hypothetical protein
MIKSSQEPEGSPLAFIRKDGQKEFDSLKKGPPRQATLPWTPSPDPLGAVLRAF